MFDLSELFLITANAYKAWWDCGRDFVWHQDLFDAWDNAVNVYAKAAGISRDAAVNEVRFALGMKDAR